MRLNNSLVTAKLLSEHVCSKPSLVHAKFLLLG